MFALAGCANCDGGEAPTPPAEAVAAAATPPAPVDPTAADMKLGMDLYYAQRNPGAAIPVFQRVLAANPGHYGATYQLAAALQAAGRPEEARPLWERMLAMAERQGDKPTADGARAALAKLPPTDPHAAGMKSGMDLLYQQAKAEEAAVEFRKILAEKPDHYGATYQLAVSLDKLGKRDEATVLWESVQKMALQYQDDATAKTAYARLASAKK